jgi:hypothetical protein
MKSFAFFIALATSVFAFAQGQVGGQEAANPIQGSVITAQTKTKLSQELDYIGSLYGTAYAPKTWKETHLGWNLPAQLQSAHAKLDAAQNMFEARQAVAELISSTSDYHVSFSFYSTEKATLPFQVKTVEGKSIIVYINREKLSETAFPFAVGDELLTVDQMPIAQLTSQLMKTLGSNVPGTDLALADLYVTKRSAARTLLPVPHGPVILSVKRAIDDSVSTVQLAWEYTPELLKNWRDKPFSTEHSKLQILSRMMFGEKARDFFLAAADENTFGLGVRKPFLPDFGTRIWQTEETNTFDAYIYQNAEGKLVGVLRIFGYIVDDYPKAVKDFAGIVEHMQKSASALVIDQNNNPGGSVFYLYSLVSMLSDQAMVVPQHRVALQPSEAKECVDILAKIPGVKTDEEAAKVLGDLNGYPATYQLMLALQDYCNFAIREFQSGKPLSEPYYLWGVDKINPNPVHFTKPIVILVNQLDFSGGDFFPAIMQDNKRVTVVGTRTAGAGGYINEAQFPNSFGLEKITFTGSIAERVNLQPIENLGVTPDIELPITVQDIRDGFKTYQKQVNVIVTGLIK